MKTIYVISAMFFAIAGITSCGKKGDLDKPTSFNIFQQTNPPQIDGPLSAQK